MDHSKKQGIVDDGKIEGSDDMNQISEEIFEESFLGVSLRAIETSCIGSTGPSSVDREGRSSGSDGVFTERLRVFREEGDVNLLLQRNDRENSVLQWLQALDLQFMGACRADERLKPLFKLNVSGSVAEDRFLAHLSQHFEAPEVGMLARCLCLPLVSVRVGKVIKQGTLLCPTAIRGNLNLTLLPTSDFCISFAGDDGFMETVATLSDNSESSAIAIEDIPADNSGRSFLIKLPGGEVSYFWCSEKSKLLGMELLAKMKDLLRRKPSLGQLTGISESRLECFATHLHAYLLGSTVSDTQVNPTVLSTFLVDTASASHELDRTTQLASASSRLSRSQYNSSQAAKPHSLYQGSLSPRSNSFKDGLPRNLSLTKSMAREKFRLLGNGHLSDVDNLLVASTPAATVSTASKKEDDIKLPEVSRPHPLLPLSFLESLGNSVAPPSLGTLSYRNSSSQVPAMGGSTFSPYYCWCPPSTSTLQCTATSLQLPVSLSDSVYLPPLSSLSSAMRSSSSLVPTKSFNLADVSLLDFPAFLPDPVVRISLPVSSFITVPSSQQIPTFTPLMCDPIVHIPVVDVCSSGQGYLVTAGPAISTTISPLHQNLVNSLVPETESVEKGARETLRLLISSTNMNPQLMEVLPAVLTSTDEYHSTFVSGSQGLYSGNRDDAIANGVAGMDLVSLQGRGDGAKRCRSDDNLDNQPEGFGGSEKSFG